jgi:hypothetical protein
VLFRVVFFLLVLNSGKEAPGTERKPRKAKGRDCFVRSGCSYAEADLGLAIRALCRGVAVYGPVPPFEVLPGKGTHAAGAQH